MKKLIQVYVSDPAIISSCPTCGQGSSYFKTRAYNVEMSNEYMDDEDGDGVPELHYQRTYTMVCKDPDMKGCLSQGDTEEEAIDMITEAIQLYNEAKND